MLLCGVDRMSRLNTYRGEYLEVGRDLTLYGYPGRALCYIQKQATRTYVSFTVGIWKVSSNFNKISKVKSFKRESGTQVSISEEMQTLYPLRSDVLKATDIKTGSKMVRHKHTDLLRCNHLCAVENYAIVGCDCKPLHQGVTWKRCFHGRT